MLCENTTAILMTFTICKLKDLYTLSNLLESCKKKNNNNNNTLLSVMTGQEEMVSY